MSLDPENRWLIAIDIDGTLVNYDGSLSPAVYQEVNRVRELGHEVTLATGRSAANSIAPIIGLGITSGHAVCSNGAVTIEIDVQDPQGYRPFEIITFDPAEILAQLSEKLPEAHFAVEDIDGTYRYHKPFPTFALGLQNVETPIEQLMHQPVSRVVVLSPKQDVEDFTRAISQVGLNSVSYSIGYTSWLDIAPLGVTKASALEKLRVRHNIKPDQVIVIGDGRNDVPMFEWANSQGGLSFAMGQAAEETKRAATAVTAAVDDDGVAQVLQDLEGILFSRKIP